MKQRVLRQTILSVLHGADELSSRNGTNDTRNQMVTQMIWLYELGRSRARVSA
jgi:hypothetical protein